MSQMSTDEDIELHFDSILGVSPVNSYGQHSSPAQSAASPTASVRRRRSQTNEHAFSSSSEGSTDEEEQEDDNDSQRQPPPSINLQKNHAPDAPPPSISSQQHSNNNGSIAGNQQSQSGSPKFSQRNRKGNTTGVHRVRSQQPQSEFDKALLTGVPSRGHATSFFSADSTDASDAPFSISDALDHAQLQPQAADGAAGGGSQLSWDETNTDVSVPTTTTASASFSGNMPRHAKKKERKAHHHRVNITTTTQSSTASLVSISSAASSPYPSNNNNAPHSQVQTSASYSNSNNALHSPPQNSTHTTGLIDKSNNASNAANKNSNKSTKSDDNDPDMSSGVLPDVLMTMRLKIESMQLFDSDMMKLAAADSRHMDGMDAETRESLKRSSQQSISAAVLVSLAHKRYERRRLAAMEIEKVVRSLVQQGELERVRAILLLLSDDYVRSTSEDARKGGVVALAACAIGLKKANDDAAAVMECRDLIVASVIHCCQDFSQRVRYYATESLFNVVKVIPGLAVQHFFILFEILRSLYADVDVDVRSGGESTIVEYSQKSPKFMQ